MKKLLATILSIMAIATLLSAASVAGYVPFEDDYVADDEIVLASFNGVKPFIGDLANPQPLEDACYWLVDYADKYNIKYVGFVGNLSSGSNHTYGNCGNSINTVIERNDADKVLIKEYTTLKDYASLLTEVNVPYGITLHMNDYYSSGLVRNNFVANHFGAEDYNGGSLEVEIESYDNNNFAAIVKEGNTKYVVYNLEAYPQIAVLDWFKTLNATHVDKRAFVYTTSFVDKNGAMFTQYDPTVYTYGTAPVKGNSTMNTNMVWTGKPFDGEQIWNYAISQFDNIVMVMSANAIPGKDIVVTKFKNPRGYETVSVLANLIDGYSAAGAFPVLAKFSEADATLDLRYAVPYENKVGAYIEESKVVVNLKLSDLPEPDPVTLLPKAPAQANGANKAYINGYAGNIFKPNANMTKAEASTIFARLLAGTQELPKGNTTKFTDVEGHWAYDAIAYLDTMGFYFTNDSDKYFPDQQITRAEFVELAYFASDLAATESIKFTDVPETHKYYDAIVAGAAAGLVNGYADGTFKPDATITRAEVVTVINRMLSLLATADTIDKTHITNVFGDIEGHWAEYQILMASNNNVHGKSFYSINPDIFTENATTISFENKHIRVTLNKKNGKVDSVIYIPTGENVLATNSSPWFAFANAASGALLEPTKLEVVDGRLKFTFKGGFEAYFIIDVKDNYFTVELDSNISKALSKITFGRIDFNYEASEDPKSYRASNLLMDTRANQLAAPGGYTSLVGAFTYTTIGFDTMGVKVGIAFSLFEEHMKIMQEVVLAVDPEKGIRSTRGGPFTYEEENKDLFYDYGIISSNFGYYNVDQVIETATKYSVNQLDLHQGNMFVQGDFNFISARNEMEKVTGKYIDGATFKERISDPIHAAGLQLGLHTYSSVVSSSAKSIITDPKWQKQIQYHENTFTLRGDLTKTRTNVKTYEDASGVKCEGMPYGGYDTSYILIDEEIIQIQQGTTSGFLNCKRGMFGTKPERHSDGAEIRQLQGHYGGFQPIPGSELFWHIGELTAKAYNEADFDCIYLDGLESFIHWVPSEYQYYYYAEFYRTVLSNCIKTPIMEDSAGIRHNWPARGRGGATDSATKAIKTHTIGHSKSGQTMKRERNYTATLGWFNFDPDGGVEYKNTIQKTMFHDELDHMGSIGIANNFSNVDNSFGGLIRDESQLKTRHADNYMYYSVYSRLRKAGYFSEEVKNQLLNGNYEYKLFKQADGTYAFYEMSYIYNIVFDTADKRYVTGEGNNPFDSQTPFIRIEQRYSTNSENEVLVLEMDETKEISTLKGKKSLSTPVDVSKHYAFKVNVLGNGSSTGGVMISITSPTSSEKGRTDYYIPTSHTGWREFILIDADNVEHPGARFSDLNYTWNIYESYRANPDRSKVNQVQISVTGDVAGVKMDDIKAYTAIDAPAKNPSVTIGGNTITFNTEIHSGEFIEFYPETGKAYLNYYDNIYNEETGKWTSCVAHTKEITYTGSVSAPAGKVSYTYSAESTTGAVLRAKVKLGFYGAVIANPADWVAPEVDMGGATLDIIIR